MSYQIYDANGYVADLATNAGMRDLMLYLRRQDDADIKRLGLQGEIEINADILGKIKSIKNPTDKTIKSTLDVLKVNAVKCDEILIVSNGMELDGDLNIIKEVTVPKAPPTGEWDGWLITLLNGFRTQLTMSISQHLVQIYIQGSAQMMSYGKTKLGLPIFYEGPPIQQAIDWARDYGAHLVTGMDKETKSRLAQVISDGIENKRGVAGLSRDIRAEFADMSKTRADLISKTETHQTLTQASQDRMEDMGVTGKEWVLGSGGKEGNCEDCKGNAAVGMIPINDDFPTPQDEIHPGCTCAIAPVMLR